MFDDCPGKETIIHAHIIFAAQKLYSQLSLRYTWGLQQISIYVIERVYLIVLYILSICSKYNTNIPYE